QIEFRIPVGVDQFVGIAKLRAIRRLWARVLAVSGADPRPALVHASLGVSLLTRHDPWGNMLRGTIACFAAGVGGADSVTIPPFDAALGLSGELGRRVARNTQLVLQREGHLARVLDPSAGSHHVESLTEDLAQAAWNTFQKIEAEGGMVAALVDGHVHEGIARRLAAREAVVATRKRPVTGVSEFPLLDERLPQVEAVEQVVDAHLARSAFLPRTGPYTHVEPLAPVAVAAPFEDLRDLAESRHSRPTILSVNLGPLARHTARATFAANLFASGGIEAIGTDGFDSPGAAVAALTEAGTNLAVLCGDDEQYAETGAAFVSAMQAAGATVWVAGKPDEALGADGFIHLGCDVVAVLASALDAPSDATKAART
ncbi:MAG: methylmalonyl-CoA mutase, partial [Glaciecola sp.]